MRLPDGDGLDLVAWIQENRPELPVAVITAHGNVEAAVRALKAGAFDFVSKPLDLGVLRKLVERDAPRLGAAAEPEGDGPPRGAGLVGRSAPMDRVRSPSGKSPAARRRSTSPANPASARNWSRGSSTSRARARAGPFVPVNCGAIPSELMESEFFGHRKGSFTGAHADKARPVPGAEGGTLFLDEVADLPLHMQVKLLRVIQEKSVRPVGANAELPVDVRILSATHKDLAQLVATAASARTSTTAST
jgi:two-component system, NtrC family, response regulator PilR